MLIPDVNDKVLRCMPFGLCICAVETGQCCKRVTTSNGEQNEFWCLATFQTAAFAPLIKSDERTSKIEACTLLHLRGLHARQSVWKFGRCLKQSKLSNYQLSIKNSCDSCNLLFQRHLVSVIHQSLFWRAILSYIWACPLSTLLMVEQTQSACLQKSGPMFFGGERAFEYNPGLVLEPCKMFTFNNFWLSWSGCISHECLCSNSNSDPVTCSVY